MIMESRRKLLKFISLTPILCSGMLFHWRLKATEVNKEFITLNGWILTKSDFPAGFINDK